MNQSELNAEETRLWNRLIGGLRQSSRWQFWIKVVLVLGGTALATWGAAMDGPLRPPNVPGHPEITVGIVTAKGTLVCIGALGASVGGILVLLYDWDTPTLLHQARSYLTQVRIYLTERDELLELDRKRRALLEMQANVHEGCQLFSLDVPIDKVAQAIMKLASANLGYAIGFGTGEHWAFSLYCVEGAGDGAHMRRIALHWIDRDQEERVGRLWQRGEGVTGQAWLTGLEEIVADINHPDHAGRYLAPPEKAFGDDPKRYLSAAAIPIRIGPTREIWGVLTATSSVAGRFQRSPHDARSQNVETVRSLGRLIAAQIAVRQGRQRN